MKEIPILFTPELAQLVHEGKKTVTRRPIKPSRWEALEVDTPEFREAMAEQCPYGQPGDLLWVRTSFYDLVPPSTNPANYQIWDAATKIVRWKTGEEIHGGKPHLYDWRHRPSVHMPKWACRTWLKVLKVSVERVQQITDDEAAKEGFGIRDRLGGVYSMYHGKWVKEFRSAWEKVYPGSWERNDLVWRVEFERVGKGTR